MRAADEAGADEVETARHNERAKLTAAYFNGIAIALLTIGGFAPSISYISSNGDAASLLSLAVTFAACFATSVTLHLMARQMLRSLR